MSEDFEATMLERAIGRTLRAWRKSRDLSLTEACRLLRCSTAKISMMENVIRPAHPTDVMAAGFAYDVPGPERDKLYNDATFARRRRILAGVEEGVMFDAARDYIELEFEASALSIFRIDLVPGLLQTADYTRATALAHDPMRGEVVATQQISMRAERQSRLRDKHPLVVEVVITEAVIRQVVGGPVAMKAQLLYLMQMAEPPNVTIQVIPFEVGAYPAPGSPFTLLSFPNEHHADVVYVETAMTARYVERAGEREPYMLAFAGLRKRALSPSDTLELIAQVASNL